MRYMASMAEMWQTFHRVQEPHAPALETEIAYISSQLHIQLCHIEISQGWSIYTMEISESYKSKTFFVFHFV